MSSSDDINTLFRRFGGKSDSYQEIVARDQVGSAQKKWPLLGQILPAGTREAPATQRAAPGDLTERRAGSSEARGFVPAAAVAPPSAEPALMRRSAKVASEPVAHPAPLLSPARREPVAAPPAAPVPVPAPLVRGASVAGAAPKTGPLAGVGARSAPKGRKAPVQPEAAPSKAAPVAGSPGLQEMFGRLVPRAPQPDAAAPAAPKKKALKW
jgi:hypothetical protein